MRFILLLCLTPLLFSGLAPSAALADISIQGAGASFPYPLYRWWALRYSKESNIQIQYDSIGSGGGIKKIIAKEVDFGATDAPLSSQELEKHQLIQFATVLGGVVPIINIPGVDTSTFRLDGNILANIYMGNITYWDNYAIRQMNPKLHLPHLAIKSFHRAKPSGTTWIFTNYLSKVNTSFKHKLGNAKKIAWPVGFPAQGNSGMVEKVKETKGAIGYAGYDYAVQSGSHIPQLKNKAGYFVQPNQQSFQAAASSVDWQNRKADIILTNKEGKAAWPIVGATFILMHKYQEDTAKTKSLLSFFNWCYGQDADFLAEMIDYVPIPNDLVKSIHHEWSKFKGKNGPIVQSKL